ncbi:uncharacterized protein METZ01_LOCUS328362 [marine metagenome]|uniref:Uncharacterized protein n=1 Tax=marine metagenome TaxID=408172 RepID=A0A382PSA0_9ZZZZ
MVNNFLSVVVAKIPFLSCYHIYPNLPIIPQTKNPTNVGLDVVERVNLF